jgi:aspartyl-tRNA(Asn)/glutamyl-tRNA(Gln) amidotransferase subunit C
VTEVERAQSSAEPRITLAEVEHVARLARLALDPDEKHAMRSQLDAILGYVERLGEIDTGGVPPTAHVLPLANVLREDEVRPSYPVEAMLGNAPEAEDGAFRVPKILEE